MTTRRGDAKKLPLPDYESELGGPVWTGSRTPTNARHAASKRKPGKRAKKPWHFKKCN